MAAPTQEYPPWLTPSAVIETNAAGEVVTSTTIVYLPLTYLGPSIPLNSLYTYGGSTYPPTIVTGFATTTVSPTVAPPATTPSTTLATPPTSSTTESITTSTAIPSSSTSLSSSLTSETASTSATSDSSTSVTTTLSSVTTSLPPASLSSTTSPTLSPTGSATSTSPVPTMSAPSSGGALSRGQLVGVIVASILGLIFLFVFLLAMWLWCKGRRNRQSGQFSTITPVDDDYFIVGEGGHTPGEGSPRHSGEEADPFLQRSHAGGMHETATELGSRPGVTRVPAPLTGSLSSSGSSSTNNSGYGVLLERPTLGILPPTVEESESPFGGYHLSEEEIQQMNRESVLPEDQEGDYTGAYAINKDPTLVPPRLVNPDNALAYADIPRPPPLHSTSDPRASVQTNPSLMDAEGASLLTARRVKVSQTGFAESAPNVTQSGFMDAIGLTNLANLGRMSWFRSENSPPSNRNSRHSPTFTPVPLSDSDMEAGRAMLHPDHGADSLGGRGGIVGIGADGQRPVSSVSARSGTTGSVGTVWHDARSSLPGTPALAPPPRALTPAEPAMWLSGQRPHSPPAYDDPFVDTSPPLNVTQNLPSNVDILDLPAPAPLTHFSSSSSVRDSGTVSSIGLSRHPFPPGLEYLHKGKSWTPDGSLSAASSSPAWHQVTQNLSDGDPHSPPVVDILEEEPPNAGNGWRSMASGSAPLFGELGAKRTTFGLPQYTHPIGFVPSEQGSLHSMRSHINPPSIRSTGSAPASRRDGSQSGSLSSNSSRPSAHSASNSIHSLGRSGSIISDGRRRFDPHLPQPPLSPFGVRGFQTPPRAATPADVGLYKHGEVTTIDGGHHGSDDGGSGMIAMPSVHFSPGASTIRTVGSGSTAMQGGRTRTTSAVTTFGAGGERVGEEAEYDDEVLPLSDANARLLGSAWMRSS